MKKNILLVLLISCTYYLDAQCNTSIPINEEFDNPSNIAVCWNFTELDNDTYMWRVEDIGGGNNGLVSESWTPASGPLTPDNWVITNVVDLTAYGPSSSIKIHWKVRTPDWSFDKERYTVYAASGNTTSAFLSSPVSLYDDLDNSDGSGLTFGNRELDISYFAGQNVYIAFRHHNSTDQNKINIDSFSMTSSTLGVDDNETESFKHFYNTGNNELTLKSFTGAMSKIEIYSILGQQVLNKKLSHTKEVFNLSNLTDGIYVAKVQINNSYKTIKFVKK